MQFFHLFFLVFLFSSHAFAQLKPGYDSQEAMELLKVNFRFVDSTKWDSMPAPERFHLVYRSKTVGFDNKWDYWEDATGIGVFSIRGTTGTMASWGANFYAGMIPAIGSVQVNSHERFDYVLSKDSNAYVHVGWTTALGAMWHGIDSLLQEKIKGGKRSFYITGHSQGGAISYLLTAQLLLMREQGKLPADIQFKTYCSGAPKPGNLAFAYYYEKLTQAGWAYNTVNALDWVPETPFSIQTVNDFNRINPFQDAKKNMKALPWFVRVAVKGMYNKMDRPTRKAEKRFEKYLGKKLGKIMTKSLPGFQPPTLVQSIHYARCGNYIVLYPDQSYYEHYPQDEKEKFINHMLEPYLYLMGNLRLE